MVNEGVDEMSMSVSRDNEADIELQGQDEFHQQGQRAKHNKDPEEGTLSIEKMRSGLRVPEKTGFQFPPQKGLPARVWATFRPDPLARSLSRSGLGHFSP